jgi:hypothetical protein
MQAEPCAWKWYTKIHIPWQGAARENAPVSRVATRHWRPGYPRGTCRNAALAPRVPASRRQLKPSPSLGTSTRPSTSWPTATRFGRSLGARCIVSRAATRHWGPGYPRRAANSNRHLPLELRRDLPRAGRLRPGLVAASGGNAAQLAVSQRDTGAPGTRVELVATRHWGPGYTRRAANSNRHLPLELRRDLPQAGRLRPGLVAALSQRGTGPPASRPDSACWVVACCFMLRRPTAGRTCRCLNCRKLPRCW